jgi:hypothetical protein
MAIKPTSCVTTFAFHKFVKGIEIALHPHPFLGRFRQEQKTGVVQVRTLIEVPFKTS